jgi:signal peptidase I
MKYIAFLHKKNRLFFIVFIVLFGSISVYVFWMSRHHPDGVYSTSSDVDHLTDACTITRETKTVRGSSMASLIPPETDVIADMGYYTCHTPERGDIVLATYVGNDAPLIKRIHGLAGDTFDFEERENKEYYILVNGERLQNSEGVLYHFSRSAIQELAKYGKAYGYVIPPNRYLLLGESPEGSMDATRFGFLDRGALVGRVAVN